MEVARSRKLIDKSFAEALCYIVRFVASARDANRIRDSKHYRLSALGYIPPSRLLHSAC